MWFPSFPKISSIMKVIVFDLGFIVFQFKCQIFQVPICKWVKQQHSE